MEIDAKYKLLREREVAEILNISIYTVQRFRISGKGPKFCKISGSVRYLLSDVQDYIQNQTVTSTSDIAGEKE